MSDLSDDEIMYDCSVGTNTWSHLKKRVKENYGLYRGDIYRGTGFRQ